MTVADQAVLRLRAAVRRLPVDLRQHIDRVEVGAVGLARRHSVDLDRARAAAIGHDLMRAETPERLLTLAAECGIVPDAVEEAEPVLLHGPVAARVLEDEYQVSDIEVLAAVASHTTARPGMSRLEKVLFLADKIEADKIRRRPEWAEVRDLAPKDLDAALLRFLDLHLAEAIRRGWHIHPRTVAARNGLL